MSSSSAIQWTHATWNPVTGCTKVSPGCAHCYIERTTPFRIAGRRFVRGAIPLVLHPDRLDQPLHWRTPRRVFVNSLSDLYHDDVPDAFIAGVFNVMCRASWHQFQVLTKRSTRLRQIAPHLPWPANVWQGVSVENAVHVHRIRDLRAVPAAVRFLSIEPLLGAIPELPLEGVHWVILGGESGPGSRRCAIEWIADVVRQCAAAKVPCFVKQLGRCPTADGQPVKLLRRFKGDEPAEWPEELRVREYPHARDTGWGTAA